MTMAMGDRVGQYVLRREIGKGAMATVYEAEHVDLGKRVALKRMHPHLASDATGASRFLREGRAATQIRSPNVVEVFDLGRHEDVPFLVMELLDGVDLAAYLRERKRLTPSDAADLMVVVASAVHAAHQAGVVHRDLKPSNILLARRDGSSISPIVLDFGISKLASEDPDLTASQVLLGTVHYMSPEQTLGSRKASALTDQYALGVMLYECLTGTRPFAGSTPYSVMHAIVSAKVLAPSAIMPSVPAALDAVVLRAMNRDPTQRFPTVRALGEALLPWASDETRERHAMELGGRDSAIPAGKGRRGPTGLAVAAVGVLVLAVGAVSLVSAREPAARSTRGSPASASSAVALQQSSEPATSSQTRNTTPSSPPAKAAEAAVAVAEETGSVRRARPPTPGVATARPVQNVPATKGRLERGTNGALIVE